MEIYTNTHKNDKNLSQTTHHPHVNYCLYFGTYTLGLFQYILMSYVM